MISRRHILRTLLFSLAALPAAGLLRRSQAFAAVLPTTPTAPAAVAPGIHMVNGWILTASDIESIAKHAR